ncbi:MAG: hypothetical protein QNJ51_19470 [Calothrix sp. MO_167.B12]|nr:hypothetical protein [Calothrix sp. MO_167.B12]
MKRQIAVFGLLAASALGSIGLATSAQAASLSVSTMHCEGFGGGKYNCFARVSGGSGRYKFMWNPGRNATVGKQTNNGGFSSINGSCKVGTKPYIKLTVKDYRTGATASRTKSFKCSSIAL